MTDPDPEADEGLCMLLGLTSMNDMPSSHCTEDDVQMKRMNKSNIEQKSNQVRVVEEIQQSVSCQTLSLDLKTFPKDQDESLFTCAHSIDKLTGMMIDKPSSVSLVDLSSVGKGNGLMARKYIRKGEVIFTERALYAAQIDTLVQRPTESSLQEGAPIDPNRFSYSVRSCQYCFRSLETSSCLTTIVNRDKTKIHPSSLLESIPHPELWPIGDYEPQPLPKKDINICTSSRKGQFVTFPESIQQCSSCHALFCSPLCYDEYCKSIGSCCNLKQVFEQVTKVSTDESLLSPPLLLTIRIYVSLIHSFRMHHDRKLHGQHIIWKVCGESCDINQLELGEQIIISNQSTRYSLSKIYTSITDVFNFTTDEKLIFDEHLFNKVAAICARNCIGITTQSPFKPYYSDLIRNCTRNSEKHKTALKKLSILLGSSDGLTRNMDSLVERACAVQIAGLFPLTARINHSCDPCAEIQSQNFIDCHMDLVAKRDIQVGEEITISYVNLHRTAGKSATDSVRRRRELQARYLFLCQCPKCLSSNGPSL